MVPMAIGTINDKLVRRQSRRGRIPQSSVPSVQHLTQALAIFRSLAKRADTERVQARLDDLAE
jgi:hypothetical protein